MTNLCKYEYGKNDVNTPLQRLDEKSFIEQLKEDDHKLKDGQQPKSSQFWHLQKRSNSFKSSLQSHNTNTISDVTDLMQIQ